MLVCAKELSAEQSTLNTPRSGRSGPFARRVRHSRSQAILVDDTSKINVHIYTLPLLIRKEHRPQLGRRRELEQQQRRRVRIRRQSHLIRSGPFRQDGVKEGRS